MNKYSPDFDYMQLVTAFKQKTIKKGQEFVHRAMYHRLDCVIVEKLTEVPDDFIPSKIRMLLRVYPPCNLSCLELSWLVFYYAYYYVDINFVDNLSNYLEHEVLE